MTKADKKDEVMKEQLETEVLVVTAHSRDWIFMPVFGPLHT